MTYLMILKRTENPNLLQIMPFLLHPAYPSVLEIKLDQKKANYDNL